MDLRITLAPDGGLRLILPQGRALDVGATPSSLHYIQRILRDAGCGKRDQRGYIGEFPTQHVIEIWRAQDALAKQEAAEAAAALKREEFLERGIDIEMLDIRL